MTMVTSESTAPGWNLPEVRGPRSEAVRRALVDGSIPDPPEAPADPLVDDDLHLALHVLEDLAYRVPPGIDAALIHRPDVVAFQATLRQQFWDAVVADSAGHDADRWTALAVDEGAKAAVAAMLEDFDGPSLSSYVEEDGTVDQLRELLVHRSAYQLREADPHTYGIPRLTAGDRKAAYVEIQFDEYGDGEPGASHAELFARAMAGTGLDHHHGAYRDRLPGSTLATVNLLDLFASRSDLTAQLVGHLALFETTSVVPMGRYARAISRLGFGDDVRGFYDVHVVADEHHGQLARDVLLGDDPDGAGLDPSALAQGAHTLLLAEDRFARSVLAAWAGGGSSLLAPAREAGDQT
jgi:hypothetical protein